MSKVEIKPGITITLTPEQIAEIRKQENKFTMDDLNSYENACRILGETAIKDASVGRVLRTIVKAANYLDNDCVIWKADFNDKNQRKYRPYHEKKNGVWVLDDVFCFSDVSDVPVGCYFKIEKTARLISERFPLVYADWLDDKDYE